MIRLDSAQKITLICIAGIIINIIGSVIAKYFSLPIFLDTYGTVFIAALGGYVPGIAVGFFTNLFGALFNESQMYFGCVSVAVAIITAFLCQRGYYESFPKVLMTIPFTVLVTSFFGTVIEEFIYLSMPSDSIIKFWIHYRNCFFNEFTDKALAILFAFFMLKIFPADWKKKFLLVGKMQAPVSEEMRNALKTESKFIRSLRTKMIFNLITVTLLVAVAITAISYMIYRESVINDRIRIADGISSMVVNEINPYRVDEFLEKGHHAEGYNEVERHLRQIRASNSDIKFLYVYKIMEDGCHVVFDLDTANLKASPPGDVIEFDESFRPYLPDLFAGRPIPPIQSDDTYGHLLTIYKPVYNSVGKCVCYAGIDFSMDLIADYGRTFIAKVIALFLGAVVFIFVIGLMFVENNIILPVNTMAYCAKNFAYDSEEAREHNIERIKNLEIKTNDEIENLYSAFVKTTEDSMHYFEKFKRAKIQVAVMDELAHTDSLTGIKNKTAYTEVTARLDADINEGVADFCIIMIDVNYLKKVNDTYGHERGNEYLINACDLACSTFGTGNVYRIGGDEFVAVLEGENIAHCKEMVANIRAKIEEYKADNSLEAWEKVSAAIGVAYYQAGVDKSADEVFKRADAEMYQNKLAMKAVRKD
ncbi:MAG: GGDEF domain-containing protein [Selenomonadaceae bacterium]|nr:GGDEF domain-containing protein [Selenomonadaceae bacterium]